MNDELTNDDVLDEAVRQLNEMPLDESGLPDALARTRQALSQATPADNSRTGMTERRPPIWRIVMMNKWTKLATAAAMIAIVVVAATFLFSSAETAYALEQTIEAIRSVRFVHIVRGPFTVGGQSVEGDERWIEIGPNGFQARYRQDSPPLLLVVDDRKTVFAHFKDKNTIVLYDAKDQSFQWIGNLGQFFADLAGDPGSVTIEEDVDYEGRRAHRVRWLELNQDVYIDPDTKLPIVMQGYDISYEEPPMGTFDIPDVPEGVTLVDKRPGAEPTEEPEWMQEGRDVQKSFDQARKALSEGKYEEAVQLLVYVVETKPRNWAWFWLGKAYYELGEYQKATDAYTEVFNIHQKYTSGYVPYHCHLVRGLAYRQLGMENEAQQDFGKALGVMIDSLRHVKGCFTFDYAEDPTRRKFLVLSDEQRLFNMINRLREVTSQNFGFDPDGTAEQKEAAIAAWETWWGEHAPDYGVSLPE